jgi:hypothetical protein
MLTLRAQFVQLPDAMSPLNVVRYFSAVQNSFRYRLAQECFCCMRMRSNKLMTGGCSVYNDRLLNNKFIAAQFKTSHC